MATTFRLSVLTPEHAFFEGEVSFLALQAPDGEIGILPGHQPMVISLVEGVMRFVLPSGVVKWAAASAGFVTIIQDEALVMLETAEWPEEIDIKRAEQSRREAEERMRQKQSMQEYHLAHAMLARAMVRLRVTRHIPNN